jgi:restriction system protein
MTGLASFFSAEPDRQGLGEPEWMPSLEVVARARANLERRGIVRCLSRGVGGPQWVAPGETPWLWWGAAALWIVLWPGLIAWKAGGELAWLPWWLPVILAMVHMLGLAAPVWISERAATREDLRRRFGRIRTIAEMLALEPSEFESWTGMMFQLLGYRVENTQDVADHGIDLVVRNPQVPYGLVQCKRYRGTVGEPVVRDLFGTLVHENADRSWLVTTGGISRQAHQWSTGKPIELWDGQRLVDYARRLR